MWPTWISSDAAYDPGPPAFRTAAADRAAALADGASSIEPRPKTRERYATLGVWLLLWLIAASLDVAAPLKLWKHYFNALVPPLCLIAGLTVQVLTDRRGRAGNGLWSVA